MSELILYTVQNSEGHWFRRYGGYGKTWVEDFSKARIYNRIGPARGIISFFANHYKDFPTPKLVELTIGKITVIDETERVVIQKQKKEIARERRSINAREQQLLRVQEDLYAAQERLKKLKGY